MKAYERSGTELAEPTLAQSQAAGFPVGGEGLAVDLADTIVTVGDPPVDLLSDRAACERFWSLHAGAFPRGWTVPSLARTRHVRDAIRSALDAAERGGKPPLRAVSALNEICASAPTSVFLAMRDGVPTQIEQVHAKDPALVPLREAARSAIELLADPQRRAMLRRCASDACSMLYVKGDARRRWCSPNICSNRDRAARHYRKRRDSAAAEA